MAEANLLTLITLLPSDKALFSITIQPLLCSDALHLDTDRRHGRPLEAITQHADCFGNEPPDHVDVVSVATCTPQPQDHTAKGTPYRRWHQEFRESFRRALSDEALARHRFATFVLANFLKIPDDGKGGLSGVFIPIPWREAIYPDFVTITIWGRESRDADNIWLDLLDDQRPPDHWSSLGYLASLHPFGVEEVALGRMFGFSVHRLPRDAPSLRTAHALTDFQLRTARVDDGSELVAFSWRDS